MTTSVIVAVSDNDVIGKDGKIPWKLSSDMKMFKEITTGHPCIMGRRTFESIDGPLKNRRNIVLTNYICGRESPIRMNEGVIYTNHFQTAILVSHLRDCGDGMSMEKHETFIIGGQQIYDEIFKTPELIHRVYLTRVHCEVEGDAFFKYAFPHRSSSCLPNTHDVWWEKEDASMVKWKLVRQEFIPKSDEDEYDSTFQIWENRS